MNNTYKESIFLHMLFIDNFIGEQEKYSDTVFRNVNKFTIFQ